MEKFTKLTATAAFLPITNIDTDMIIPKQYLKTIKRTGLGQYLFAEQRYDEEGSPDTSFILNRKPDTKFLLAGENFGCGSSREHAPWALLDFGIRVIIAPSFADIFYNNSYKNGLLLVNLDKAAVATLAESDDSITIDLKEQTVSCSGQSFTFEIDHKIKDALLNGYDAIQSVLVYRADIESYEKAHFTRQPWIKGEVHA